MEQQQGPNKAVIGIIVVVLLAGIGGGVAYLAKQGDNSTQLGGSNTSLSSGSNTSGGSSTATSGNYKDGSYKATASFQTPDGIDGITVNVTLANNVVTNVSADTQATSRESQQYDDAFLNSYKSEVVGKNVNEIQLSRTAGASLTSDGFNKALDEIRQNANA